MTRFDWAAIAADNMSRPLQVPDGDLVDALLTDLTCPDPAVRDDLAYPVFRRWTTDGEFDGLLQSLGDRVVDVFVHPEIQARTFAALALGWVLRRGATIGGVDSSDVDRWRGRFAAWWSSEQDLRGYDQQLGWLHAVAHGADTVRAFALFPRATHGDLTSLLDLCASRMLAPTDYLFAHAEDDRLAYAIAILLSRPELTDSVGWLAPIAKKMEEGEPGPVPAFASNTIRTLNSLYVAVHRGVVSYDPVTGEPSEPLAPSGRTAVLDAIGNVLRLPSFWLAEPAAS